MKYRVCPRCAMRYTEHPAISRYADVEICPNCGLDEAIRGFLGMPPISFDDWYEPPKKG